MLLTSHFARPCSLPANVENIVIEKSLILNTRKLRTLKKADNNEFELVGNLTMKGVAKGIKLDTEFGGYIKDGYGNEKAGFSINGTLNRKDFGLNWNSVLEAGGVTVGNEIKINAEVQFVKESE